MLNLTQVVETFPSVRIPSESGGLAVEVSLIAQIGHEAVFLGCRIPVLRRWLIRVRTTHRGRGGPCLPCTLRPGEPATTSKALL